MAEAAIEHVGRDGCDKEALSAENPDWTREAKRFFQWYPSRSLLSAIRAYQRARGPLAPIVRRIAIERHRFWSIITSADIPIRSNIAGGLIMPHPNGIVIAPDAVIGPNCLLFQQVTIGATTHGYPELGGGIDVGAGARILGPIRIGNHAKIGANAVVVTDIPVGATAIGVPARVVNQKI